MGDAGLNSIGAFAGIFNHQITGIIHNVSIVAISTDHTISGSTTIEAIVAIPTHQGISTSTAIQGVITTGARYKHTRRGDNGLHIRKGHVAVIIKDQAFDSTRTRATAQDIGSSIVKVV